MNEDTAPLIGAIEDRAGEERERLVAEARDAARDILAAAEGEIEGIRAQALRGLDKELVVERQRLIGEAQMRARDDRLRLKRRMLAEGFRQARQEIQHRMSGPGIGKAVAALAAEAASAVGGPCDMRVDQQRGTVVATSKDGRKAADNSLEARMARAETSLETDTARMLGLSASTAASPDGKGNASGGTGTSARAAPFPPENG